MNCTRRRKIRIALGIAGLLGLAGVWLAPQPEPILGNWHMPTVGHLRFFPDGSVTLDTLSGRSSTARWQSLPEPVYFIPEEEARRDCYFLPSHPMANLWLADTKTKAVPSARAYQLQMPPRPPITTSQRNFLLIVDSSNPSALYIENEGQVLKSWPAERVHWWSSAKARVASWFSSR